MLLRDLTLGNLRPLLDSVILLVVPIYNTDGNDDFAPGEKNRPGQNGPAIVGRNTNGQGLNLNRDYVKLEAPETRGALALLAEWEPDFFIDLHTTNGSYHGYALTYAPGLNPNSGPANDYVRDHFLPLIRERLRKRHREETFWYGNFRNQNPDSLVQGWETYDPRPRFGTNAWGLKGRLAILSEGYSNAPFKDRIEATYNFLREILALAAEERTRVRAVVEAADAWLPDSVTLHSVLGPPTPQDVIAEITQPNGEGNDGFARRKRSGVFKTIRMPVFDRFVPALREVRPAAYLVPPEHADLIAMLRAQGVIVFRAGAWRGAAERFTVDSVNLTTTVFEGHRAVGLLGRWASGEVTMPEGWFYVPTSQRLGVFASYMLEPMSEDGFVTWNFLDRDVAVGGVFPVARLRQPLVAPMELVP
jgi:hypothetical protein